MEGLFQKPAARAAVLLNLGVVAGGQQGTAHLLGRLEQSAEFDGPVAQHAGIGGLALLIGLDEGVHHLPAEGFRQVQGVVGDGETLSHRLGVSHVPGGVALGALGGGQGVGREQGHGKAHRIVARLL